VLYIVDCCRDFTIIHRIDYDEGEYLMPLRFKGYLHDQATDLLKAMHKDKCSKIIFDKMGMGIGLHDVFEQRVSHYQSTITVDENGNVKYY